ncbi:MAG: permease [Oscillospiraceae bacterium]|nr:permease [Oscillospiraceae bacterium]
MIVLRIPVYVVTGFLGSGKTTLINELLDKRPAERTRLLLVSFESGEEEFGKNEYVCRVLSISKKELESSPTRISERISDCVKEQSIDEIWVEWNGMTPFSELHSIFLAKELSRRCRIEKVVHMADADTLENLLGKTGAALPAQLSACDIVALRHGNDKAQMKKAARLARSLNSGVKIADAKDSARILSLLGRREANPVAVLSLCVIYLIALFGICSHYIDFSSTPLNTLINVFIGIILQAVPFLLIGVLISSAIQVFVSSESIERRFPKKLGPGMLCAVVMGFFLPVCDCASVPIFRSLVKKGVPISAAVTFLTAAPVINPVVMLSTYYAFNGSLRVVAVRAGLGIAVSLLLGLFFAGWPSRGSVLSAGLGGALCSCGCGMGTLEEKGLKSRLALYLRHAEGEFFSVGKFLIIGAFISALFQAAGTKSLFLQSTPGYALSVLLMMALAFLLSLCSSSDAVIARSFSSVFPAGAIMGFLVFGPMMDIKNLLMLSGGFSKKFVLKLLIAVFLICFLVVAAFARPLLGG